MSNFSLNTALLKTAFKIDATYRFRVFIWMCMSLTWVIVYPVMWFAVYGERTALHGFSRLDVVTYFLLLLVVEYITLSYVEEDLHEQIREGQVSALLLKPVSFVRYFFFIHIGYKLFPLAIYAAVFTVAISLFHVPFSLPEQWLTIPLTLFSLLIAHFIAFNLKMILACAAFWIEEAEPVRILHWIVSNVFMGWVGPIVFFPHWFQLISEYTPWQYIMYFPVMVFLEQFTSQQLIRDFSIALVWLLILILVRRAVVSVAIRHYNAVGN